MELPVFRDNRECQACELHQWVKSPGIGTRVLNGWWPDAIVFVGRNPGADEDYIGEPFVGRSGVMLRGGILNGKRIPGGEYVDGRGFRSKATIYITNPVRCFTIDNAKPPLRCAKECTTRYLLPELTEIAGIHERVALVMLGAEAVTFIYKYVLGIDESPTLSQAMGQQGVQHDKFSLFATFHPAYLFRKEGARNQIGTVRICTRLVDDWLLGRMPVPSEPFAYPAFFPSEVGL